MPFLPLARFTAHVERLGIKAKRHGAWAFAGLPVSGGKSLRPGVLGFYEVVSAAVLPLHYKGPGKGTDGESALDTAQQQVRVARPEGTPKGVGRPRDHALRSTFRACHTV